MSLRRLKLLLGSALLVLVPTLLVVLLLDGAVRRPLGRTLTTVARDWSGSTADTVLLPATGTQLVKPGDPVFLFDRPDGLTPAAYVTVVEPHAVRVRFAAGESQVGPWRLRILNAPHSFREILDVAMPSAVAGGLRHRLEGRLTRVLEDTVLPDLERKLPAFFARLDPRNDPETRALVDEVGGEILERLKPFMDRLVDRVAVDLEAHFGLLDRLGLVWKVVRGDGEAVGRQLMPVATRSAEGWWTEHQNEVLAAVGEAVSARSEDLRNWLSTKALTAAKEELAAPVFASQRDRLEREAEAAIKDVVESVVIAPHGGFTVRVASVLRTRFLGKTEALLLLEKLP